jgi:hypothetical protein
VESAYLWSGNAATGVNMHPSWATTSRATGVSNGRQAGRATIDFARRAVVWSGTSASAVDIHPKGASESGAHGIDGSQVVGFFYESFDPLPGLSQGFVPSWLNLNPGGRGSTFGSHGGTQVGFISVGHACLWRGTPGSIVSLHPVGQASNSIAHAVYDNEQVGRADLYTKVTVACLWRGTAASRVNLHSGGTAFAVFAGQQVGRGRVGNPLHALRWVGSAPYATDLHLTLPSSYTESVATGVWDDAELYTYVSGYATDGASGRHHAVLWKAPNITTANVSGLSITRGSVLSGNLNSLLLSDGDRLFIRPGPTFSTSQPPIELEVEGTPDLLSPKRISLSMDALASASGVTQKVEFFDFQASTYVPIDSDVMNATGSTSRSDLSYLVPRFIQPGSGLVRARVTFRPHAPMFSYPWHVGIDRLWWHAVGLD